MQTVRPSIRSGTTGIAIRATALLLLVGCSQAFASTAKSICDRSVRGPESLDIPVSVLTVDIVDHGTLESDMTADNDDMVGPALIRDATAIGTPDSARDAVILRQIFNDPADADTGSTIDEAIRVRLERRKDVAADSSTDGYSSPEPASSRLVDDSNSEIPDINAHLPGISEDNSHRYRREMYRTDI